MTGGCPSNPPCCRAKLTVFTLAVLWPWHEKNFVRASTLNLASYLHSTVRWQGELMSLAVVASAWFPFAWRYHSIAR